MKRRLSSISSACFAARALFALGVVGVAACSVSPGAEGDDGGHGSLAGDGPIDVAGVDGNSETPAANAETDVGQPIVDGVSPPVADSDGSRSPAATSGSGSVTPASSDETTAEVAGADDTSGRDSSGDGAEDDPSDSAGSGPSGAGADGTSQPSEPSGDTPSAGDGDALQPGAEQDQVATLGEGTFTTFAVGAGSIYLVDRDAAVLVRVPTAGGAVEPISPALQVLPHRLAVDESGLYAALFQRPEHTELWRLPSDGGDFDTALGGRLLGEVRSVAALGVNAGGLVSFEARPTPSTVTRIISRADAATGGVTPIGSVELAFSNAFAIDESAAYVVRGAEGISDIVRVDLVSAETSSLASAAPDETLRDLAVAAGEVYFASTTRVGRTFAGQTDTLDDAPAYRLAVDGELVYFLAAANAGCTTGSRLYRVAASGGSAEHLATESTPGCIANLAADADGVYWLTADGGRLRGLPVR